jgi:hypothetical protein
MRGRLRREEESGVGRCLVILVLILVMSIVACTPALNWREAPLADAVLLMFPCKPERVERTVTLAGVAAPATMLVCEADGRTWSATAFSMPDEARRDDALREARHLLAMNLAGVESGVWPMVPSGLAASPESRRLRLWGHRPGGAPLRAEALFAAEGRRALQLVVLWPLVPPVPPDHGSAASVDGDGDIGPDPAVEEFFAGLRRMGRGSS